ncbi:MAG TPA: N-acetylmuramoyl-L-alanine amidase [Thermomicrobiales bacterium]|nr:N-acetylmuramoyl-L-alanine amidase [Thermomicrobiales bacterium]
MATAAATPDPNLVSPTERLPAEPSPTPSVAAGADTSTPDVPLASGPVIVLDPGHDRTSPGALGIEYQVVLHAAYIAKEALEAAGYQVFLTRTDNETSFVDDLSLLPPNAADMHPGYGRAYAHASRALQFNPDMVIVLHFNGHPNPDVAGIEIYYCEMGGPQNLELAYIMRDELAAALRSISYEPPSMRVAEDLGVARGGRHFPSLGNVYSTENEWIENRYSGIPVVLTEPLYMTNEVERELIDDDATHRAIAEAYVRVANEWFGR